MEKRPKHPPEEQIEEKGVLYLSRRDFLKIGGGGTLSFLACLALKRLLPDVVREINKKREAREPEISIDFFFLRETPEDERKMEKLLDEAGVFIPEGFGWDDRILHFYNEVSQGEKPIDEIINEISEIFILSPTETEKLRMIHRKKISVFFIDVPLGHGLYDKSRELDKSKLVLNYTFPFKETVKNFREGLREEASFHREREDLMIEQLREVIRNIKKDPRFKDKDKVKILLEIGASHTRLYHLLRFEEQVGDSSMQFSEMPFTFSFIEEVRRRYWFLEDQRDPKKVKEPTDELIAKIPLEVVMNGVYFDYIYSATGNVSETRRILRRIISKFSSKEIEELFKRIKESHVRHDELAPWEPPPEIENLITEKVKEKGISVPEFKRGHF